MLSCHPKYLGNVEQERRNLTLWSVEKLAEGMGVDPTNLQQPLPREIADGGYPFTLVFSPDADDVLEAVLGALAAIGVVVSVRLVDGSVVVGVPTSVDGQQVLCRGWDEKTGVRTDEMFSLTVADIVGAVVL